MSKIRIVIVDDHKIVRHGLKTFLGLQDDLEVVGEGENGREAIELAKRLKPDVILLDLIMPEMDGVEATQKIVAEDTNTRVAILTSFSDEAKAMPALEAGAVGYLLKDIAPDKLADTIRAIHRGETVLNPEITKQLMDRLKNSGKRESRTTALASLTNREIEVLRHLAQGMSNDEIADALFISSLTVKTHVSNLLAKLDLADRTQAAIYAIRHGIAPLDPLDST